MKKFPFFVQVLTAKEKFTRRNEILIEFCGNRRTSNGRPYAGVVVSLRFHLRAGAFAGQKFDKLKMTTTKGGTSRRTPLRIGQDRYKRTVRDAGPYNEEIKPCLL